MGTIERLDVYPVKGFRRTSVDEATVLDGGTLERDREFALFDADGDVVNGKRAPRVHDFDTTFDPETGRLGVTDRRTAPEAADRVAFDLDSATGRERASAWFSDAFEADLTLERSGTTGFVDRPDTGPSVISTATLRTVASWFDGMTVDGARRRLRANVEVSGVPAFWEDRFVGRDAPSFVAGDVRIDGVTPCGRCVVPERDPDTGDHTEDFRETFVRRREETFPDFADPDAFEHFYAVMLIASVPDADRGKTIRVGDSVEVRSDATSE